MDLEVTVLKAKFLWVSLVVVLIAAAMPRAQSGTMNGAAVIRGTIKSADGSPMEGVAVSARSSNQSWTTSVFSDRQGQYYFPALDAGEYRVWAQAVGFEAAKATLTLGSGRVDQNLSLTPNKDIAQTWMQMSGTEMLQSLPDKTLEDLRGKRLVANNCTGCHTAGWVLQNRFDEQGWGKIVDLMAVYGSHGRIPAYGEADDTKQGSRLIRAYRDEIVTYLGRVRGATEVTSVKPLPRPTGEATQVVVTEYDFPRTDNHHASLIAGGSDWSLGTTSRWAGRAAHDVWVAPDGIVWSADDQVPLRTTASLNPRTGEVKNYYLKDELTGLSFNTHSIHGNSKTGQVWLGSIPDRNFLMFDPKTEQFTRFPKPADFKAPVGGVVWVDVNGNLWATSNGGAVKMDIKTKRYSFHESAIDDAHGYGAAADRKGNGWATQPGVDRVIKIDGQTGKVSEVEFRALDRMEVTALDRSEAITKLRAGQNSAPPQQNTPRRMSSDPSNDLVWVSMYTGNAIAKIDINTLEKKEYKLPNDFTMPYSNITDKNGNVWINGMSSDRIIKFDPKTEKFTEYKTPTLGAEIRHITVDDSTDPPTVWVPYGRSNKIVRFQFRTAAQQQTRLR